LCNLKKKHNFDLTEVGSRRVITEAKEEEEDRERLITGDKSTFR
jgi:hypothetical protein